MFINKKKIVAGLLGLSLITLSSVVAAQDVPLESPNNNLTASSEDKRLGEGTYFEKLRLNTQKFETVETGNYLREDYICQQVPSACRDANGQEAEDRWYSALPAYTEWVDDGEPHSHEGWLPEPNGQLADFQQSQVYQQPQTRYRQEREQAVPSGDYRNVGEPQLETRDEERTEYRTVEVTVLNFVPDGNSLNCSTWLPETDTVNLGELFTQTRNCEQNASRDVEYYADASLLGEVVDEGVVTIEETQEVTGTRDYITGERAGEWTAWEDVGVLYDCGPWTPTPDTQPLGSTFTQTADCSMDQTHERQIYNVYASGAETEGRVETESQTVPRQDSQQAVGSEDYIDGERIGDWENTWSVVEPQVNTNCGAWSPSTDTVSWGDSFTQTRTCDTQEEDFRTIYDVYKSGKEEARETERRLRTVQVEETQVVDGTRDFVASTYDVDGAWTNDGALYNCVWTPHSDTVDVGETFTQSGECDRNQVRTITTYNVWASKPDTGREDTVASTRQESRTIKESTMRQQTGTGEPVIEYGTWGSYSTYNTRDCTPWSPGTGSVPYGDTFTQERYCTYDQERFRSRTNVYPSGRTESLSDQRETRALTDQTETRSATGTQEQETSTYVTYSEWTNSGDAYNCTWSPSPSTIDVGTSFIQTGDCSQDQTRTATTWSKWLSGKEDTVKSTSVETRTIPTAPTRSAIGTGEPTLQCDSWSAYSTYDKSCDAFSPAENTVNWGESFIQSRTCTYYQERTRTCNYAYPSGRTESTTDGTRSTRTLTGQTETRSNTGTKDYVTGVTYKDYKDVLSTSCRTDWSPDPSTVNAGTTYTQYATQDRTRRYYRDVYDVYASGNEVKTIDDQHYNTNTGTGQCSRTATGTKDYVVSQRTVQYNELSTSCRTDWTPHPSTVYEGETFQQGATQDRERRYYEDVYDVYYSGKEVRVVYRREYRTPGTGTWAPFYSTNNCLRNNTGTKDPWLAQSGRICDASTERDKGSPYYASGSYWSPTPSSRGTSTSNYTQTRAGIQPREYYCYDTEKNAVTGETRKVNGAWENAPNDSHTFSRYVSVSRVGPYNVGTQSCTSYSPLASTVCSGKTFTQSRTCTQPREYRNDHKLGTSTFYSYKYAASSSSSTQSRSATGTKSCTSWSSSVSAGSSSTYYSNCPGPAVQAARDAGYGETSALSGSCTAGSVHKYHSLQYAGSCKAYYYKQTCE